MKRRHFHAVLMFLTLLLTVSCSEPGSPATESTLGRTVVNTWKDGKKAAFLISFDDNLPSQLENVVPLLDQRQITGTFYVVPGGPLWAPDEARWIEAAQSPYIVLANHTFTHEGVNSVEELDAELSKCNDVLYGIYANRSRPFLLSFGQPGGVPWNVTPEEQSTAFQRHFLVERPPFRGSPMNYTTPDELLAAVDESITQGAMGHVEMHGVGGDYLETPVEWLVALLDKLEAEKDQLWVPDQAAFAQYVAERDTADVRVISASANEIRATLTTQQDPAIYNYPLTLTTEVPAAWRSALVTQAGTAVEVPVVNGAINYDARPGPGEIRITPRS